MMKYISDPDNRDYLTIVECVLDNNQIIDFIIILSTKIITERHIIDELNSNILISTFKTDYNNDELSIKWLLHYNRYTRSNRINH